MSNHIETKNSELFIGLSEEEQEAVTGGGSSYSQGLSDFFMQMTNIRTFSNSEINVSNGAHSISSKQQTGYMLSQLTFGFSGGGGRRGRRSRGLSGGSFLNMLFGLLSLFE